MGRIQNSFLFQAIIIYLETINSAVTTVREEIEVDIYYNLSEYILQYYGLSPDENNLKNAIIGVLQSNPILFLVLICHPRSTQTCTS